MTAAIRINTKVLPGQRIEVATPQIPEGSNVELVIYVERALESGCERKNIESETGPQGFPELDREYESLIEIQWSRSLTDAEQLRLNSIKATIDLIDAASPADLQFRRQIAMIHEQLATIRQEVESLPAAS